ncbi:MAG: PIN domain-containing protein [Brevundimonas sp.]
MKVALDTNVLAYAAGVNDGARRDRADRLISSIDAADLVLTSQVAGELYNVLVHKGGYSRGQAAEIVEGWIEVLTFRAATPQEFTSALSLARDHDLQIWDALILCVAAEARCALLLSEDMQDGFVYRGVTVANPFAERLHPLLASLLDSLPQDPPAGAPK